MSDTGDVPEQEPSAEREHAVFRRQRFGRVTGREPSGSGPGGRMGTYFVHDDQTGDTYSFSYPDIVTEGFRTIRTGERVRFLTEAARPGHAVYVVRLDLPDIDEYYE
jgi:hypothetical protein